MNQEQEAQESFYTTMRMLELLESPVVGNFDSEHLKEINRRIFQDLPLLGFTHIVPGQYRPSVPSHLDWYKERPLEDSVFISFVAYSRMDNKAKNSMDKILEPIKEKLLDSSLSKMTKEEFTNFIADLYVQLDYIHPFSDGNSRTLRTFTSQIAKMAGFEIKWEKFAVDSNSKNILFIARDLSVNRIAINHISHYTTRQFVNFSLEIFQNKRDLKDLLKDVVFCLNLKAIDVKPFKNKP